MDIHLKVIGVLLLLLALVHLGFPKRFNWTEELASISLINRQLMYVHTFFIGLVILLIGLLCLTSSAELYTTALGRKISLGLGMFWFVRLYFQFFGYSSQLWKGKMFETTVHILSAFLWVYLSTVFLAIWFCR